MSNDISLVPDFIVARDRHILPPAMISPEDQPNTLQEYLQREAALQGIDHEDIAARAKEAGYQISATYINNMMNGSALNPSAKYILALAAGLHKKDPTEVFRAAYVPSEIAEVPGGEDLFYSLARDFQQLPPREQEIYGHHINLIHQAIIQLIKGRRKK